MENKICACHTESSILKSEYDDCTPIIYDCKAWDWFFWFTCATFRWINVKLRFWNKCIETICINWDFLLITELIVPGFNASYQVNDCGVSCRYQQRLQNPVCQGNKCICDAGFEGDECRKFVCSPGCLFNQVSIS